ncbi:hypothetical protein ACRALDRAFT_2035793 [Sodiomyces alcalophilus JCM 7366]|uniref:uncharacterized protein n=1 Tax=Sodiomyces alcalophilus JCM 7366 TaxID=591952 RepID=UPI0039B6DBF7
MTMLTAKQPMQYGYKSVHDLPTPPSTSRLSPPLAYPEPPYTRRPSIPRNNSSQDLQMSSSAPPRGLPPPAAMALPPHQSHAGGTASQQPPPPGQSSGVQAPITHSHALGQLPGPPPQWQDAEDSMRSWLAAKSEEERRRQEEERTKQESLRLEQRRIEADMLRTSLQGGIPPAIVPLVFAGMGGAVSPAALEAAHHYLASPVHGQHPQLMPPQGQRSPEQRRDSQAQGYSQYAGVPSTPGSAVPHGYPAYPASPTARGRAQTLSSATSTGRPLGPGPGLPGLNTGTQQPGPSSSLQSHGAHAMASSQPATGQQESHQSPGIYFHHWQPPTSQAGSSNQPATPSVGGSPRQKRKATGAHPAPPAPPAPSQQRPRSPGSQSGPTLGNPPQRKGKGHMRQRSDVSTHRPTGRGSGSGSGDVMGPAGEQTSPRGTSASKEGEPGQPQTPQQRPSRSGGGHSVSSLLSQEPTLPEHYPLASAPEFRGQQQIQAKSQYHERPR